MEIKFINRFDFEVDICGRKVATGYIDFKAAHLVFGDTRCEIDKVINLVKTMRQNVFVHFE